MESARLARLLKEVAQGEGFELAGICRPEPSEHGRFLEDWLAEGRHGEMDYLARPDAVARRQDLSLTLPDVRSVLVVAHEYAQPDPEGVPDDPSRGVIARYARGRDYHRVVKKGLERVHRRFEERAGREVQARAYVDTAPILERDLARRAGIGWFGRNTMILNPRRGSYFFLGVLLLEEDLEPDTPFEPDHCGTCRSCLDACPTGALLGRDSDGAPVMDARLCISYLTIEHRGPIPRELRPLIGNRVYGCDICQEVCPFTRKSSEPSSEAAYAARGPGELPSRVEPLASDVWHPGTDSPPLIELLEMALDTAAWDSFSRGSAIRRAGRAGFARNVCVALGNWASADAVPVLTSALSDPEPLVRAHAAWALGRIPSGSAVTALEEQDAREKDTSVSEEISAVLGS